MVEEQLKLVDADISFIEKCLAKAKLEANVNIKLSEEAQVAKAHKGQLEFEQAQLELKLEYDKKSLIPILHKEQVKFPKLAITKFNGTYQQWLPFGISLRQKLRLPT